MKNETNRLEFAAGIGFALFVVAMVACAFYMQYQREQRQHEIRMYQLQHTTPTR